MNNKTDRSVTQIDIAVISAELVEALQNGHEVTARELARANMKYMASEIGLLRHQNGWTTLHAVLFYGPVYLAEEILQTNVNVKATLSKGVKYTREGREKVLNAESGTIAAVIAGNLSQNKMCTLLTLLADKGVDVNAQDSLGHAPIFSAAGRGLDRVLKLLIAKGANVNLCDKRGWSPLHFAAHGCHKDVCRILLENGAVVEQPDLYTKETPLHRAVKPFFDHAEAVETVKLLLDHGADPNLQTMNGDSALHFAAQWTSPKAPQVLALLVMKKGNVNLQNKKDYTPLHFAAVNGLEGNVKTLLQFRANVIPRMHEGKTAADLAPYPELKALLKPPPGSEPQKSTTLTPTSKSKPHQDTPQPKPQTTVLQSETTVVPAHAATVVNQPELPSPALPVDPPPQVKFPPATSSEVSIPGTAALDSGTTQESTVLDKPVPQKDDLQSADAPQEEAAPEEEEPTKAKKEKKEKKSKRKKKDRKKEEEGTEESSKSLPDGAEMSVTPTATPEMAPEV
ncbi:ankyrin repeat and protein kinase domain-containing protein 1 [Lingula anatina]|uniref:Ankyrin repeat and protein kinase domain-containing protein 1 n=1 Tax=Lingula anatina TaxID=7574 RepID=A0A1S3JDE0_LINAN|nr:ankyrin repeat and protein kinase domain-containing protein 1 [Lingula anatina]|eukprot:XP_013408343.1 ankyrin repeat and protein kinase domain-containing protein 1 [Lingula anatina]